MRTTRSSSSINAAASKTSPSLTATPSASTLGKRKADTKLTKDAKKLAKQEVALPAVNSEQYQPASNTALVPAVLTFDFREAKRHLIQVDHRFEDLFQRLPCKPFEHLEQVHPFRALVTSILGQQISWLAARSIIHKFTRLYDPSLPEKPDDEQRKLITSFPTPEQVTTTDAATLRTAGLSARKVEYVQDLSARFADGRLSTQKLLEANDDELAQMLIEVRGIGKWTVDMFAIFSLRRPDILPVGDLGVQRGLLRWFLHLHSPSHTFALSPQKVGGPASKKGEAKNTTASDELPNVKNPDKEDGEASASSLPIEAESIPPTFTPSIKQTLDKQTTIPGTQPVPLPSGINVALLKSRLSGKKIKGAFITPQEMADLTEQWKPYRSIGVYYMWSLAEAE